MKITVQSLIAGLMIFKCLSPAYASSWWEQQQEQQQIEKNKQLEEENREDIEERAGEWNARENKQTCRKKHWVECDKKCEIPNGSMASVRLKCESSCGGRSWECLSKCTSECIEPCIDDLCK